jgi:hypothetical protein
VGTATRHARLLDRRAASAAWLARPSVDAELVLHRARWVGAVAEIRTLAHDATPKRSANALT